MELLYLSHLCSDKEYERMFQKQNTTVSHAAQKFHRLMLNGLMQNGCRIDALTQRILYVDEKAERRHPDETENGVHYTYLPCYGGRIVNRLMTMVNAYRAVRKWHKAHPQGIVVCDIILGELSLAVLAARKFSKLRTVAIVTDVPNIRAGDDRKGLRAIPKRIKNAALCAYDGYIFLTQQMNTALNPKGKPYTVIEGIVDGRVADQPNTFENKEPHKVCMMAGLLEDVFGVDELLQAFTKVQDVDARLVFYGKGSAVSKIESAAARDERISYRGEVTNRQIVEAEKKATLLINPRPPVGEWTAYSFPSKNMEYIASGTPMLAYVLPCIPQEYLEHFYCAQWQDGKSDLAQKLTEIFQKDREQLHKFGLEAQQWIVNSKNAAAQTHKAVEMMRKL